jgi:non-heme chloroperoxidase
MKSLAQLSSCAPGSAAGLGQFPSRFDPLDPSSADTDENVQELRLASGRTVRFIDQGDPDWQPLVFFGGLGTSVGAFFLTEFARSLREALRLRVISVERNGFGRTAFDPSLGYDDGAADVLAVLNSLHVARFSLVAFSGGGPFAGALAARAPARVRSLHLAAAAAGGFPAGGDHVGRSLGQPLELARRPEAMWAFRPDSPVHRIPGFAQATRLQAIRAIPPGGLGAQALAHELRMLRVQPLAHLRVLGAPAYLYWGTEDDVVPEAHTDAWAHALRHVVSLRRYPGEAHDVQYRHWDQILIDAAGLGERTLLCRDGRARLARDDEVTAELARGATLGLCAWERSDDL